MYFGEINLQKCITMEVFGLFRCLNRRKSYHITFLLWRTGEIRNINANTAPKIIMYTECKLMTISSMTLWSFRLFEKYPDVQQLFVHFRGMSADELRHNKRLRDHGLRVLNTLDKCITRIDEPDRLEKLLLELGQKHVVYNIKVEHLYVSTTCHIWVYHGIIT